MADPILKAHLEAETRALLAGRQTWLLLAMWEMTECAREDMDRAGEPLGVLAAAQLIDWTIDELDARYPLVMARWLALGELLDLQELYRDAYRQELNR